MCRSLSHSQQETCENIPGFRCTKDNDCGYCEGTIRQPYGTQPCKSDGDCGQCTANGKTCDGCCDGLIHHEDNTCSSMAELINGVTKATGACGYQPYGSEGPCGRVKCLYVPSQDPGDGPPKWCGPSDLAQCKNKTCSGCIIDGICQDNIKDSTYKDSKTDCLKDRKSTAVWKSKTWCGNGTEPSQNWAASRDCSNQCPNCNGKGKCENGNGLDSGIMQCTCDAGYSGSCCQLSENSSDEEVSDKCTNLSNTDCLRDFDCMWDSNVYKEGTLQLPACYSIKNRASSVKDWPVTFCAATPTGTGFNCQNNACVSSSTGKGEYETLNKCKDKCKGPKPGPIDKKMSVGIIILIVVLCILALVGIFFYFRRK